MRKLTTWQNALLHEDLEELAAMDEDDEAPCSECGEDYCICSED